MRYNILNMSKFYFINTYGCQMNVHESEKIAGILEKLGYISTNDDKIADIIVFNTHDDLHQGAGLGDEVGDGKVCGRVHDEGCVSVASRERKSDGKAIGARVCMFRQNTVTVAANSFLSPRQMVCSNTMRARLWREMWLRTSSRSSRCAGA